MKAARRDTNHAEIRDGLRALGWSVHDLGSTGDGCPDLAVGIGNSVQWPMPPPPKTRGIVCDGLTVLVEVKTPGGKLTADQQTFAWRWRGSYLVVESLDEAVEAIERLRGAR